MNSERRAGLEGYSRTSLGVVAICFASIVFDGYFSSLQKASSFRRIKERGCGGKNRLRHSVESFRSPARERRRPVPCPSRRI